MGVGISIGISSPSGSSPPAPPVPLLADVVLAAVLLADVVLAAVLLADVVLAAVLLAVVLLELPPPLPVVVLPPLATALLLELLPPSPSSGVAASSEQPSWEAPAAPSTSSKVKADFNPNLISLPLFSIHDGRPAPGALARRRPAPSSR
ncbi:hypothetical protein [Sorangium sp. So ce861]|uniref:hypothetical protein n=1 Tax=Sorangium sp. So ce861 TaxID=3133323 RepID=UPI003F5EA31D